MVFFEGSVSKGTLRIVVDMVVTISQVSGKFTVGIVELIIQTGKVI